MPLTNVTLGKDVRIFQPDLVNLYGCTHRRRDQDRRRLSRSRRALPWVHAARSPRTASSATGVTIEDEVFVGHGVMFINDARAARRQRRRLVADGGRLDIASYAHLPRSIARFRLHRYWAALPWDLAP